MRLVPGGAFRKSPRRGEGASPEPSEADRRVLVGAFYLAVFPVTNVQFVRFLSHARPDPEKLATWLPATGRISTAGPSGYEVESGYERHPVANVSWLGAEAYCRWAELRLPTEDEWLKAAGGAEGREFPWGDEWRDWCVQEGDDPEAGPCPTAPVDAHREGRSPYGLYQMAGNVEEWCAAASVGPGPDGHLACGGSCLDRGPAAFRCAARRVYLDGAAARACVGFRCACGVLHWERAPDRRRPCLP